MGIRATLVILIPSNLHHPLNIYKWFQEADEFINARIPANPPNGDRNKPTMISVYKTW